MTYNLAVMALLQLWSDFVYGSCIDAFLKSQAGDCEPGDKDCPSVYMYLFTHRSEFEPLPFWMGKNCGHPSTFVFSTVQTINFSSYFVLSQLTSHILDEHAYSFIVPHAHNSQD